MASTDVYNYDGGDTSGFQRTFSNGEHFRHSCNEHGMVATWDRNGPDVAGPVPLVIWCHGGFVISGHGTGAGRGFLGLTGGLGANSGTGTLWEWFTKTKNMCLMSMEFTPGQHTPDYLSMPSMGFGIQQILEACRAVQFARQHADNPEVFPTPIDRNKIIFYGFSQGAQLGLIAKLMDEGTVSTAGRIAQHPGLGYGNPYVDFQYDYSHVPDAVIAGEPFGDPTQASTNFAIQNPWYFDSSVLAATPADAVKHSAKSALRATGPHWWLKARGPALKNNPPYVCLYNSYAPSTLGWTFELGVPDVNLDDSHDHEDIQPLHDEALAHGFVDVANPLDITKSSWRTYWGDSGQPGGVPSNGAQDYNALNGKKEETLIHTFVDDLLAGPLS